jgi:pimeloyl-ACP methyl ester carboxylesterase
MPRQVLIVHGWSDTSKSFHALAEFLKSKGYKATELWLGDYISMDDDVRVADVGKRMGQLIDEMIAANKLESSFDVIVHSTGGLVAREWLTRKYRGKAETCPMRRLIMLAPANYGSKLAATGKSMLGRIIKGYNNWFHTGTAMLNDLELASPYQLELVQRDILFAPGDTNNDRYYGEDRVWPFVIVGTHPYPSLLRQIVNENGADGTVRVCAANLNAQGVTLDFREQDIQKAIQPWGSRLDGFSIPLAVLPTRTHGSIVDPDRADSDNRESVAETPDEKARLGKLILQALACDDFGTYKDMQSEWDTLTESTAKLHSAPNTANPDIYHQYMQANISVFDDYGQSVKDYFLEFFSNTAEQNDQANVYFHRSVIEDVKINSQNASLRNMYFDRTDLVEGYYPKVPGNTSPILYLSISAASPGKNINYFEAERVGAKQEVPIHCEGEKTKRWLKRNSTHFIKIIIPRLPKSEVFRLTRYDMV